MWEESETTAHCIINKHLLGGYSWSKDDDH